MEIRFHGLGGHGAVVASKILADAAAKNGFQSQSFASYGALRRGGKVESYVRISEGPVRLHCKMYTPDWLVLLDDSFAEDRSVIEGLKDGGKILVNTKSAPGKFPMLRNYEVFAVDAGGIAGEKGLFIPGGMPVINTTILGALAGLLEEVQIEQLIEVIEAGTPKPDINAACAREGLARVTSASPDDHGKAAIEENGQGGGGPMKRKPRHEPEKLRNCHRCQICYMACPTLAISFKGDPLAFEVNGMLCNACGICIEECPRKAIVWEGS